MSHVYTVIRLHWEDLRRSSSPQQKGAHTPSKTRRRDATKWKRGWNKYPTLLNENRMDAHIISVFYLFAVLPLIQDNQATTESYIILYCPV